MPYDSGPLIRQALLRATPWQRYAIGVGMIAFGVVLAIFGHIAGGLLAVAGVVLLWPMVRYHLRRSQGTRGSAPGPGSP
jgi:membrane-bound metal-dependent hydrolase YbcI (DUF457 family)